MESWLIFINNLEQKHSQRTVKLAKNAGFCYGVKRAVETTKKLKIENPSKNINVLGELIHNSHVISELENLGIKTLNSIEENSDGICVVRSHGESYKVFEEIKKAGYELVDLTCLDVKKVQSKAMELALNNYFVIILGKKEHPEVKAISTNALHSSLTKDNVFVANSVDELKQIEEKIKNASKVGVVLQTTQTIEYLFEVVDYLSTICKVLRVQNTICPSTSLRQQEAKKLAQNSDLMVVVGSKKSANTTHLAQIAKEITKTIHIEHQKELDDYKNLILNSKNIGVTAGASTPDNLIQDVINYLESIN